MTFPSLSCLDVPLSSKAEMAGQLTPDTSNLSRRQPAPSAPSSLFCFHAPFHAIYPQPEPEPGAPPLLSLACSTRHPTATPAAPHCSPSHQPCLPTPLSALQAERAPNQKWGAASPSPRTAGS